MYRDPIGHRVKQLNKLLKRKFERRFGKPDNATLMQRWTIGFVHTRSEQGIDTFQKDIENELCITRSTTSEMLKLMCAKNMITRESVSHDARLKKIVLTREYEDYIKHINDEMMSLHEDLVEGLSDEEIDTYIRISDKLISNLSKDEKIIE